MPRYCAYQARLAGHPVGETFRNAMTFLCPAAAADGIARPAAHGIGSCGMGRELGK